MDEININDFAKVDLRVAKILSAENVEDVNNLKHREMKFGTSEGMILASSNDEGVYLIASESGAQPGDKVT